MIASPEVRDAFDTTVLVASRGKTRQVGAEEILLMSHLIRVRPVFDTDAALAAALGVHRSRISAWKSGGRADPQNAELLASLAAVITEARKILPGRALQDWLTSPQDELRGSTPIEALRDQKLTEVLQAANAMEHLAYA